jgi:hypothetical protein
MNNKPKIKTKKELQKKYDNLSLVDRNAYEQIIERNKSYSHWLNFPSDTIKGLLLFGLLFIVTSTISGVDIEIFRLPFLNLYNLLIVLCLSLMAAGIIYDLLEYIRINKLKRKLLSG